MAARSIIARQFPWTAQVAGDDVVFRLMTSEDGEEVRQFVARLPEEDLFDLMDYIRTPAGMRRWIEGIRDNTIITVLAEGPSGLLGCGTLRCGYLQRTRHQVGEVRIMVSPSARGKGTGKLLGDEVFAAAREIGLRRIIARLTSKQLSARYLFERLGLHIEAVLADCVIDGEGRTQDMILMSDDVSGFHG